MAKCRLREDLGEQTGLMNVYKCQPQNAADYSCRTIEGYPQRLHIHLMTERVERAIKTAESTRDRVSLSSNPENSRNPSFPPLGFSASDPQNFEILSRETPALVLTEAVCWLFR